MRKTRVKEGMGNFLIVAGCVMVFMLVMAAVSYTAKVITLDRIHVDEVRLRKKEVLWGEPAVPTVRWCVEFMYTMKDLSGNAIAGRKVVILSDAKALELRQLIKPVVNSIKTETTIDTVENYVDPGP